ncbi:DUF2970 domain-containing protein [Atopomonas sediminilitoris]|uniref:DUF2970 domain-containing protein n=1 Tax=Atopomonas sediminilitoris TaxID=2919919 RepID=UPI001F4D76D5|nr:DUF2970 domain-containing protein [Atopomonas sediminilitoris]MCJ8168075.1 DUF2970 domain-containing protein [Atopomonas sediminilitoris]
MSDNKLSLWQVILSVLAAAFGVQSDKTRQRDFRQGSPKQFIIVGLLATVLFVLLLIAVVKGVLALAGVS